MQYLCQKKIIFTMALKQIGLLNISVSAGLPDHMHEQYTAPYRAPYGSSSRVAWEGVDYDEMFVRPASKNNPIYGNSTTVTPESLKGIFLIKY